MNKKMLLEHIERNGMVTMDEIVKQTGWAQELLRPHALSLMESRDIFLCRLDHGRETLVSKHLVFCLSTFYTETEFSEHADNMFSWLSENQLSSRNVIYDNCMCSGNESEKAFKELQEKMCAVPLVAKKTYVAITNDNADFDETYDFLWVTTDYWADGLYKEAKYNDLAYCISEVKRLLSGHFTSKEINSIIYQGTI